MGRVADTRSRSRTRRSTAKDTEVQSRRQGLIRWIRTNPWLIAVVAPILTAGIIGVVHVVNSKYHQLANPAVVATADFDSSRNYVWTMAPQHPLEPQSIPSNITSCERMRDWLIKSGTPDTAESRIRLHLVGIQEETVTVSGVHAEILSREPSTNSAIVSCPSAGTVTTPHVALDLRQASPNVQEVVPSKDTEYVSGTNGTVKLGGTIGNAYFASHVVQLRNGEPFDLAITAFVAGRDVVRWRLVVDVERQGRQGSVTAEGRPFVTASSQCARPYDKYWQFRWDMKPARIMPAQPIELCNTDTLPY
jgi:hypothetical protein